MSSDQNKQNHGFVGFVPIYGQMMSGFSNSGASTLSADHSGKQSQNKPPKNGESKLSEGLKDVGKKVEVAGALISKGVDSGKKLASSGIGLVNPLKDSCMKKAVKKLREFENEAMKNFKQNRFKAKKYKWLNIGVVFLVIFILLTSVLVAFISENKSNFSIIGPSMAALLKLLHEYLGLSKKAVQFMYISLRYSRISDQIKSARDMSLFENGEQILLYISQVQDEINEVEMDLFKFTSGPKSIAYNDGIVMIDKDVISQEMKKQDPESSKSSKPSDSKKKNESKHANKAAKLGLSVEGASGNMII